MIDGTDDRSVQDWRNSEREQQDDDSRDHRGSVGGTRRNRRAVLTGIAAGLSTGLGVANATAATATAAEPWRIAVMPDTQAYVSDALGAGDLNVAAVEAQTEWIAANADAENIAFVSHEGDVVWNGDSTEEFERMDDVMGRLDGVVPYGACVGNHDYHIQNLRASSADTWKQYFGESRYENYGWYGGSDESGRNHYQLFEAGGYEFCNISLEFEPPGNRGDPSSPVGWAQRVIDDHPDRAVIITTHAYLSDGAEGRYESHEELSHSGNTGQKLWEKLVQPNDQVFMVLAGHFHEVGGGLLGQAYGGEDDGQYHQVSQNDAGSDVYELLANYQDWPNGGNGWMRIVSFVPGGGDDGRDRIEVETYSPHLDEYRTGPRSEFGFDLNFDDRFTDFAPDDSERQGPCRLFCDDGGIFDWI